MTKKKSYQKLTWTKRKAEKKNLRLQDDCNVRTDENDGNCEVKTSLEEIQSIKLEEGEGTTLRIQSK